jgi:hypothetical protein
MWDVPYFQLDNILAVGITTTDNTVHNRKWFTKIEKSSYSPDLNFNKISQQPENCENRNDPDLVQAFLKKWSVESDFKARIYIFIAFGRKVHDGIISLKGFRTIKLLYPHQCTNPGFSD